MYLVGRVLVILMASAYSHGLATSDPADHYSPFAAVPIYGNDHHTIDGYRPDPYHNSHPKYGFDYAVYDEYSGNDFGHQEVRDGHETKGSYYVKLPDGRLQKVSYYVSGDSGFVAEVTYELDPNFQHPSSQLGHTGSQLGHSGSQFGHSGSQLGHSGSQFGPSYSQLDHAGGQFGHSGSQFGHAGGQFGHSGSQFGGSHFDHGDAQFGHLNSAFGRTDPQFGLGDPFLTAPYHAKPTYRQAPSRRRSNRIGKETGIGDLYRERKTYLPKPTLYKPKEKIHSRNHYKSDEQELYKPKFITPKSKDYSSPNTYIPHYEPAHEKASYQQPSSKPTLFRSISNDHKPFSSIGTRGSHIPSYLPNDLGHQNDIYLYSGQH